MESNIKIPPETAFSPISKGRILADLGRTRWAMMILVSNNLGYNQHALG
jgi:hypothetical protein